MPLFTSRRNRKTRPPDARPVFVMRSVHPAAADFSGPAWGPLIAAAALVWASAGPLATAAGTLLQDRSGPGADASAEVGADSAETAHLLRAVRAGDLSRLRKSVEQDGAATLASALLHAAPMPPNTLLRLEPLVPLLARGLDSSHDAARRESLRALGLFQSRDAVRPVIASLIDDTARRIPRDTLVETLVRQTGRDDLGRAPVDWARWWEEAEFLTEGEWRRRIAAGHAQRARRQHERLDDLHRRLVAASRRIYLETDAADRPAMLVEFLGDSVADVRALAIELAERELLNARPLGDDLGAATLPLLRDEQPRLRIAAASLLSKIAPRAAALKALDALAAETDHEVAAALLPLLFPQAGVDVVAPALRWLASDGPAREAAARVLLSADRSGLLTHPEPRRAVLRRLNSPEPSSLSPVEARLLARLGSDEDRSRLADRLDSSAPPWRLAVAEALLCHPEHHQSILDAANYHHDLAPIALEALALHARTASSTDRTIDLARRADLAPESLVRHYFNLLPPGRLLHAITRVDAADIRLAALQRARRLAAQYPTEAPLQIRRLLLRLAQAQLDAGDAQAALATCDIADAGQPANEGESAMSASIADRSRTIRLRALVRLDRLDQAEALDAPAREWLMALEDCVREGLEHSKSVHARISEQMREGLSADDWGRLEALSERLGIDAGNSEEADGDPGAAQHGADSTG